MPRVLAVELDPAALAVVSSVAQDARLTMDVRSGVDAALAVAPGADIEAVVLGNVAERVRFVRRCQASLPRVPLLVFAPEPDCQSLLEALRFSPFGERELHCVPGDRGALRERMRAAIHLRRRRASANQTFSALNQRLSQGAAPTRAANAVLGQLLEIAPIGIALVELDGRVRELNARAVELLGDGAAATRFPALFDAATQPQLEQLLTELLDPAATPRASVEVQVRGRTRHLDLSGRALLQHAGGPGYLIIIEDTTERDELVRQLRSANRAKDEFIAMLGHELRNPLAPVRTAVELLRMRPDPTIARECGIIERHVGHMVQLVDDLLDVTRITQGKLELRREHLELGGAIERALEMTRALIEERGHTLTVRVPASGLPVWGDASRLTQVFTNLLTNAAKYTPPGGQIVVAAELANGGARVRVRDTGTGIAPDILPSIFDLFVQERQSVERSLGGLGLGLAIVRSLVNLHGGTVAVDSEVGRGSEFVVQLPLATVTADVDSTSAQAGDALTGMRILVVDDNEDAATLLAALLETLGAEVALAYDGAAAVSVAQQFAPRVILLDLGLPILDGFEVAAQIQTLPALASTRIVALSGYGQREDLERTAAAGFAGHLVKPVSLDALRIAISAATAT